MLQPKQGTAVLFEDNTEERTLAGHDRTPERKDPQKESSGDLEKTRLGSVPEI